MLDIPNELLARLHEVADKRGMSIEKLLNEFVRQQQSASDIDFGHRSAKTEEAESAKSMSKTTDRKRTGVSAGFACQICPAGAQVRRASKEKVDTSARSREILNNEFADYVDRRIRK